MIILKGCVCFSCLLRAQESGMRMIRCFAWGAFSNKLLQEYVGPINSRQKIINVQNFW